MGSQPKSRSSSFSLEVPVRLSLPHKDRRSEGTVHVQKWNSRERLIRALKTLGACWALAMISVLIPLAHFILVPAFLLAGPIAAFAVYQRESMIMGGKGTCPNCDAPFTVAKGKVRWPFQDLCSQCQSQVMLEPLA